MADDQPGLFELPDHHRSLQAEARELADSVRHLAAEADDADRVHPAMRAALAASGLAGVMVPAEYGGRNAAVDSLAATVVREALAGVSAHLDSLFAMQGIGTFALARAGADAVRARWLPAVAAMDAIAALAVTEPHVGSDLKAISTTVEERGGRLRITGHKSFITNAGDADTYAVLAREADGYSLVLVPADTPGLSTSSPHQIIAPHVLGDVVLDGAEVPADHRIGGPGEGFSLVMATLATFRVSVAGAAVGMAEAALMEAVRHSVGREQFGMPLARLGSIPEHLATAWTEIEMARSLTYRAAAAAARDPLANLWLSSMAKAGATEMAGRVVDRAVQVAGRFGVTRGTALERFYREARPMRIYEGSTEVIYDSLARQLTKKAAQS
ncbi:acyl-CoA dehydrogenase family protein [Spirillospora sp. NPDC048819]|uniref:acyl-CoA dehydrogenase family protein n=1 Tax=Spirillospora sp. NPDC048819 TaxID=3155268 RepID=UPI0033FB026F